MDICVKELRSCTCQERYAKDMLTLTCWRAKYDETVQRIFTSWFSIHCIYICFFLFDASTKKLFESFHFHVLFCFCLAAVVVQVNTENNIQYLWLFLYIQIKYIWKSIIVSSNTVLYTIPILHSVLTTTFFSWSLNHEILVYFSDLLAANVNLILWLKVYM